MTFFITEKQTEQLLMWEKVMVPVPGGARVAVGAFRLHWEALEEMSAAGWTIHRVGRIAWNVSRQCGKDLDYAVQEVIRTIHAGLRSGTIDPLNGN